MAKELHYKITGEIRRPRPDYVGPHDFRPLRWRDRLLKRDRRCRVCFAPRYMHPYKGASTARPLGNKRKYVTGR